MNRRRAIYILGLVAVGAIGGGIYYFNFADSKMIKICEAEIKSRLRSPSGYQRISVEEDKPRRLTIDEWVIAKNRNVSSWDETLLARTEMMRKTAAKPVSYRAYISYDAPNAYGALIRSSSTCEYLFDGKMNDLSVLTVTVDGETGIDYLRNRIGKLRN